MKKRASIGFDRVLKKSWLDDALILMAESRDAGQVREQLKQTLGRELEGEEARRKTLGVLGRIWLSPPEDLAPLRNDALEICRRLGIRRVGLSLHWGMSMAVYPFFGKVAGTVGRLLRLQDSASLAQVQRRIAEQVGERSTAVRAGRRVIQSMTHWNILRQCPQRGHYQAKAPYTIPDGPVAHWLIEAQIEGAGKKSGDLQSLLKSPLLFPFDMPTISPVGLQESGRLEVIQSGYDCQLVKLIERKERNSG